MYGINSDLWVKDFGITGDKLEFVEERGHPIRHRNN